MTYILLDRDGVINEESQAYIKSPSEWLPIPGSIEAIAALTKAGFSVLIATNQSGISRGLYSIDTLHLIHEKLQHTVKLAGGHIEAIVYCPHHPDDNCLCRKPKIGMLQELQARYGFSYANTHFIGDSASDIEAAQAVGCQPILVLTGNGAVTQANRPEFVHIPTYADLYAAVNAIIGNK